MNTPDTEWERQLRIDFEVAYGRMPENFEHVPSVHISDWWLEKLSSRDTYWKERVEEAVKAERERILKACDVNSFLRDEDHEDFVVYLTDIETITKATPITEDNLK